MRSNDDFLNAFGKADDRFKEQINQTLEALQRNETKQSMKRISAQLVIAIVIVLLMTTVVVFAVTNSWGILDFINIRYDGVEVLPEAEGIVQTDLQQQGGQTELVSFTVREAIFDGRSIYIVVQAKPQNPNDLLLGTDAMPADPVTNIGPLFEGQTGSIADYAQAQGKRMVRTWASLEADSCAIDFITEEDGTLVYMIRSLFDGDDIELEARINCGFTLFATRDGRDIIDTAAEQRATIHVTLSRVGEIGTVTNMQRMEYPKCGVRVDKITLTATPMAIYAYIEYTVTNQQLYAAYDGGFRFDFVDDAGQMLPSGASPFGEHSLVEGTTDQYTQSCSLRARETLPDTIILCGRDIYEKIQYESHTFQMK